MARNCILNFLGLHHLLVGELPTAERLIDEDRLIADATGNLPVTYAAMLLTAWQGPCARGVRADPGGRPDGDRKWSGHAFERDHLGFGRLVVELAEATARTGDVALVQATLD
jgi:hypothetical protein